MYTAEQLIKRNSTPWTKVVFSAAMVQLCVHIFVGNYTYLTLEDPKLYTKFLAYMGLLNFAMVLVTFLGVIWEKEVFSCYFLHNTIFWEDVGNSVALIAHVIPLILVLFNINVKTVLYIGLIANMTYFVNFVQWIVATVKAAKQNAKNIL